MFCQRRWELAAEISVQAPELFCAFHDFPHRRFCSTVVIYGFQALADGHRRFFQYHKTRCKQHTPFAMKLIFLTKRKSAVRQFDLSGGLFLSLSVILLVALVGGAATVGFTLGRSELAFSAADRANPDWAYQALAMQRSEILKAKQEAEHAVNALSGKLGQMEAKVIRIEALGSRLVQMAKLDSAEFDFDRPPALGGPESESDERVSPTTATELVTAADTIDRALQRRYHELAVLENLLLDRQLQDAISPQGRPIVSGWLSSPYGVRNDPISGRRAFHDGIDFAGKTGSPVIAVADGLVAQVGARQGYGKLIEINHGNGYRTRYGHNSEVLVAVGEKVSRGQQIARMGSTGRSTGPHVHFEVLHNGKTINPRKFIYAANH
ncbi:MAG: M23 family metallopeptidase [Pseudomonadota bacterium]|nr:M23 family metallopeptidase [Pseudomonadota bacterium]